jgi:hypothetical protein
MLSSRISAALDRKASGCLGDEDPQLLAEGVEVLQQLLDGTKGLLYATSAAPTCEAVIVLPSALALILKAAKVSREKRPTIKEFSDSFAPILRAVKSETASKADCRKAEDFFYRLSSALSSHLSAYPPTPHF